MLVGNLYLHVVYPSEFQMRGIIKRKGKEYNTVGTIPKPNIKIIERGNMDTLNTQIHDISLSWLSTGI